MSKVTIPQALAALDDMDDYCRMATGVDPIGPRKVLEQFIRETVADQLRSSEQAWALRSDRMGS